MSRVISEVSTDTYLLIIQRPDGAGLAATSNDQRLRLNTTTFEPDVNLRPGELVLDEAMLGSRFEVDGQLSSPAMSSTDLVCGRWSGASLKLLSGDWQQGTEGSLLCEGELGPISMDSGRLSASIDILPSAASSPPCIQTSPECRAILGDQACRIDMRSRRRRAIVTAVEEDSVTVDASDNEGFVMGRLRWMSGANCGLEQRIIAVDGSRLVLSGLEHVEISPGDRAVLSEGCDGRRVTCSQRFANMLNFRGEPDLPGSRILFHFPGA